MEIIDQVLVICVAVDCFDMSVLYTVFFIDCSEHRCNRIGRAARGRNNRIDVIDLCVIYAVHNIF